MVNITHGGEVERAKGWQVIVGGHANVNIVSGGFACGAMVIPVPVSPADMAEHFDAAVCHAEAPVINGHAVAKYILSRAVRDVGIKVVLTGEGADDVFGGYAHYRRDMLLYNDGAITTPATEQSVAQLVAKNPLSAGLTLPFGETVPLDVVRQQIGFVPTWIETHAAGAQRLLALMSEDCRESCKFGQAFGECFGDLDIHQQMSGREPLTQSLYLWSKTILPGYLLSTIGDRMEMAHSVEGRVPYLDYGLVEYMRRIPSTLRIRGNQEKYLLRRAARPFVTDTIYTGQKHPFLTPPPHLTSCDSFWDYVNGAIREGMKGGSAFFDPARVVKLLDMWPGMSKEAKISADPLLMIILSVSILQRRLALS